MSPCPLAGGLEVAGEPIAYTFLNHKREATAVFDDGLIDLDHTVDGKARRQRCDDHYPEEVKVL